MVSVRKVAITSQDIFCEATPTTEDPIFFFSIVRGSNDLMERKTLWKYLVAHSKTLSNDPWIIMSDFNATINLNEKIGGSTNKDSYSEDLNKCRVEVELDELRYMENF